MQQNTQVEQAAQMESILRDIKHTVSTLRNPTSSNIVNAVNDQLVELINNTFEQQQSVHSNLGSATALFNRRHGKVQSIAGYDDIFQEQLNFLLQAAADMKGIKATIPFGTGQQTATSAAIEEMTEQLQYNMLDIARRAAENLKVSINQQKRSVGSAIVATSGKVDLKTPDFEVIGDANDIINRLLKVFSGKTFTLKNYASYTNRLKSLDQINIHLGNTNLYKAVTGGLSQILLDTRSQNDVYYRGMTILSGRSEDPDTASPETINTHFAHLRFMYELRGTGLYTNGASAQAEFIIWNDPSSQNIVVRSTKDLIARYIDNYTNAFSAVTISASML